MQNQTLRSNILERFTTPLVTVGNGIAAMTAWIMVSIGVPVSPIVSLVVLCFADLIFGVVKARVTGEDVSSRRFGFGVAGKCCIVLLPIMIAVAAKGIGKDFDGFVEWAISAFIISELYSIISNIIMIKTGQAMPEWSAISLVAKKMRSIIESLEKRP